jgi:hypothetical protein
MAFVYGDRVKETSLSVGTGVMTLGGATAGFRTFADGVGVGNDTFYGIVNTVDNTWEMGRGTVGVGSLQRNIVISSSNANSLVNFGVGDKLIYTTVPSDFFEGALDVTSHSGVDHTSAPLNLLDANAHANLVDHTAAPLNLITQAFHESIDHTAGPYNLLNATTHAGVDHTLLGLLDTTAHNALPHTGAPLFLLDTSAHAVVGHDSINNNWRTTFLPQVTVPERTAGTELNLRSFSPADIAAMAGIFGGGGGGGGLNTAVIGPSTFVWNATSDQKSSGVLPFTPVIAFAFAAFHHSGATLATGSATSMSWGVANSISSFSVGQLVEAAGDGNDMTTTLATGSIAGVSGVGNNPNNYKTAWDLATINVTWGPGDEIKLTPSTNLTGSLVLIVLG